MSVLVLTGYSVLAVHAALWARVLSGVVAGLFFGASMPFFVYGLRRRFGALSAVLVLGVLWGVTFFLLAIADPNCPSTGLARRCTWGQASSYLGIGLLLPVTMTVIVGPGFYLVHLFRRTTPEQHRHPVHSMLVAMKVWATRVMARRQPEPTSQVPVTSRPHATPTIMSSTSVVPTRPVAPTRPAASAKPSTKPPTKAPSGIVHNKRVTSSPRRPKP